MSHDNAVFYVAFSPDGRYVLSGSIDNTARVWSAATGDELARMTHEDQLWALGFSRDGKYIVSAGKEEIRVWAWQPADLIDHACRAVSRNLTRAEWTKYLGNSLPYEAVCPHLPVEPEPASPQ
jgi:WD40 repeat protein